MQFTSSARVRRYCFLIGLLYDAHILNLVIYWPQHAGKEVEDHLLAGGGVPQLRQIARSVPDLDRAGFCRGQNVAEISINLLYFFNTVSALEDFRVQNAFQIN